jgi:hypothetical protein
MVTILTLVLNFIMQCHNEKLLCFFMSNLPPIWQRFGNVNTKEYVLILFMFLNFKQFHKGKKCEVHTSLEHLVQGWGKTLSTVVPASALYD